jgi:hypothetical protein
MLLMSINAPKQKRKFANANCHLASPICFKFESNVPDVNKSFVEYRVFLFPVFFGRSLAAAEIGRDESFVGHCEAIIP